MSPVHVALVRSTRSATAEDETPGVPVDIPSVDALEAALEGCKHDAVPNWGKMNAPDMLHHVADFGDLYFGRIKPGAMTSWVSRLIGPFFLRSLTTKDPLGGTPRNLPTLAAIKSAKGHLRDWESGLSRVRSMLHEIANLEGETRMHPMYGTMHTSDFKALILHHTAHHFHQFGLV